MSIAPEIWLSISFPRSSEYTSTSTASMASEYGFHNESAHATKGSSSRTSNDGDSFFATSTLKDDDDDDLDVGSSNATNGSTIASLPPPSSTSTPSFLLCSKSKTKLFHFAHRWTLDNFSKLYHYNICSTTKFTSPSNKDLLFRLSLVPKGDVTEKDGSGDVDYLALNLALEKSPKNTLNAFIKLSILDDSNVKTNTQYYELELAGSANYQLDQFIRVDTLLNDDDTGFLPDDRLTLYLELSYDSDEANVLDLAQIEKNSQSGLVTDFANWLDLELMTDATLLLDGKQFHVHKAILSARSPIFAALFLSEPQKDGDSTAILEKINDVEADVFLEILRYIYTGKVQALDQLAEKVYEAAHKFCLYDLKEMCEDFFCATISSSTITPLLKLAHEKKVSKLSACIVNYLARYSASFANETSVFESILQESALQFYDVFTELLQGKSNNNNHNAASKVTRYLEESSWSHTATKLTKFTHKWTVSDFAYLSTFKSGSVTYIESSTFSPPTDPSLKCALRLYPKGSLVKTSDHLSLYLYVLDYGDLAPKIQVTASILGNDGQLYHSQICRKAIYVKGAKLGWELYCARECLSTIVDHCQLLVDDELNLYLEIQVLEDPILSSGQLCQADDRSKSRLSTDLATLVQGETLADIVLFADNGSEYHVHKAILAARSSVFASILERNSRKPVAGLTKLEISDVSEEVLRALLEYIYTGKITGNAVTECIDVEGLLVTANEYQLVGLMNACEVILSDRLSVDSVARLLLLADSHDASYLKSQAIAYITNCDTSTFLRESSTLKATLVNRPKLFQEVLASTLKKMR